MTFLIVDCDDLVTSPLFRLVILANLEFFSLTLPILQAMNVLFSSTHPLFVLLLHLYAHPHIRFNLRPKELSISFGKTLHFTSSSSLLKGIKWEVIVVWGLRVEQCLGCSQTRNMREKVNRSTNNMCDPYCCYYCIL